MDYPTELQNYLFSSTSVCVSFSPWTTPASFTITLFLSHPSSFYCVIITIMLLYTLPFIIGHTLALIHHLVHPPFNICSHSLYSLLTHFLSQNLLYTLTTFTHPHSHFFYSHPFLLTSYLEGPPRDLITIFIFSWFHVNHLHLLF